MRLALASVAALLAVALPAQAEPGAPVTLVIEFEEPASGPGREPSKVEASVLYCTHPLTAPLALGPTRIVLAIEEGAATVSPNALDVNPAAANANGCARSVHATVTVVAGWRATLRAEAAWSPPFADATALGETPPMRPPETRGDEATERAALGAPRPLGSPYRAAGGEAGSDPALPLALAALGAVAGGALALARRRTI